MIPFETLLETVLDELKRALLTVDSARLDHLHRLLLQAERIFVAGKGRSGLQMSAFAMRLMHLGLPVHVVGEATTPGIAPGDILVIGSGSGRTASLVSYAARAHELRAQVALITTAETSLIGDQANCVVRIDAPTPKIAEGYLPIASIQPMGTLFEQSLGLLLDLLILQLMHDRNLDSSRMFDRHANLE